MLNPNYSQQYFIHKPLLNKTNFSTTPLYYPNNQQISYPLNNHQILYIPKTQQLLYPQNNHQISYIQNNQQILYPKNNPQISYIPNNQDISLNPNIKQKSYIQNNNILNPKTNQQLSYIQNNQQILLQNNKPILSQNNQQILPQNSQEILSQNNQQISYIANNQELLSQIPQNNQQILTPNNQQILTPNNQQILPQNSQQILTPINQQILPQNSQQILPQNSQEILPQNNQQILTPNNQQILPQNNQQILPQNNQQILSQNNQQISYIPSIQEILSQNNQEIQSQNQQIASPQNNEQIKDEINSSDSEESVNTENIIGPVELPKTQNFQRNTNTYIQPIGSRIPIEKNHYQVSNSEKNDNNSKKKNNSNNEEEESETSKSHESQENNEVNEFNELDTSKDEKKELIIPGTYYDISYYVEIIRNHLQNMGKNEDLIVTIIENTKLKERESIRKLYKQKYKEDLIKKFQKELNGDIKESVIGSFMNPIEYDTYWIYNSLRLIGKKSGILTEIIGSRTISELKKIKTYYAYKYGETLKNEIDTETYGDYKKLLLALLQCKRSNSKNPDTSACANDASDLYKLGIKKRENDIETFIRIFTTSSPFEISIINHFYKQQSGKGLLTAIDSEFEFSAETKNLLATIVKAQIDPYGFYSDIIHDNLDNLGNNNLKLIRNICARFSVDMPLIKQAYLRDYEIDLLKDIQTKVTGNLGKILYSIVYKEK